MLTVSRLYFFFKKLFLKGIRGPNWTMSGPRLVPQSSIIFYRLSK